MAARMIWCDVNARVRAGRRSRSAVDHLVTFGVCLSPSAPRRTFISGASDCGERVKEPACVPFTGSRPLSGVYLVVGPAGQEGTGRTTLAAYT